MSRPKAQAPSSSETAENRTRPDNFVRHEKDPVRVAYLWTTIQGQVGAPWETNKDVADFASKVGAPRPSASLAPKASDAIRFAGSAVPAFAELRLACSDVEDMRFDKASITSGMARGDHRQARDFIVRGLIPTQFSLWRRGLLSQTAQFALRVYKGRCPKTEEQPPAVMLEHWRWASRMRGELAAYDGSGTAGGVPEEFGAMRQAAFAMALAHETRVMPANELSLALLPAPPRSTQVDRNDPSRKLLLGELSALAIVEFSSTGPAHCSVTMSNDRGAPSPQIVAAIKVHGEYTDQRQLARIAHAFDHFTAHCFILGRAQEVIDKLRKLALDERGDPAAIRNLWRDFLGVLEPLWAFGDAESVDSDVLAGLESATRLSSRWLLVLQRGSQLFDFAMKTAQAR